MGELSVGGGGSGEGWIGVSCAGEGCAGGAEGAEAGEEVAGLELGLSGGCERGAVDVGEGEFGARREGAKGAEREDGAGEGDVCVGGAGVV